MHLTNFHFYNPKNSLYSKPIKGLRGYGVGYGFAFNGKELDNETQTQDYGMRIYDYRLGKFLSVDPLTKNFAYYTPYQFAGNKPIEAIDLDGLEPEYIIDRQGKLTAPVITLFNELLGHDVTAMQSLCITKNGNPINYGETHSESDVRTDPSSNQDGNGWLRTIGHELTHQRQYAKSTFHPFLNQIAEGVSRFFKGSKSSAWEKEAYKKGNIMQSFTSKYNPDAVLKNSKLTTMEKQMTLTSMVLDYKINLAKNQINANQGFILDKRTSESDKEYYKEQNNMLTSQINSMSQEKNQIDKALEDTKTK